MTGNRNVAVEIMDGNKDIFLNYCGIKGQSVDEHTMFELGSTTKAFTGLGILWLELNDPPKMVHRSTKSFYSMLEHQQ